MRISKENHKGFSPCSSGWRFATFYLLACSALWGAEVFDLDPLTVRATRVEQDLRKVPYSVSVVGATEIQRGQTQLSLEEALEGLPGVFVLNPTNFAQDTRIAIRGAGARADFGIRGIQLIVDGIPATTPDGQGEVDGLDLGSAARIEVLRGPSSVFYGAASGGVIRIETESGPSEPMVETRWTVGENGLLKAQVKTGGTVEDLTVLLSISHLEISGHREQNLTRNRTLNGKVELQLPKRQMLRLVVNLIDYPRQDDPGGLTRAQAAEDPRQARPQNVLYDGGERVAQERIGLQYRRDFGQGSGVVFNVHSTHRDFANKLPFENGGQVSFQRHFYGGRGRFTQTGDRHLFSLGFDADVQIDDRQNNDNLSGRQGPLVLDQKERVEAVGLYSFFEYEPARRVRLTAGLRHDWIHFNVTDIFIKDGDDSGRLRFSALSPSAGVNWDLSDSLTVYTSAATSFETPTTTEFDNPSGAGFNKDLQPQEAISFEAGLRQSLRIREIPVQVNFAAFHMRVRDSLVPYELPEFPGREFFRNAGESTHVGAELKAVSRLPGGFSLGIDLTFSDFRYDRFSSGGTDFSDRRIPGVPEVFGGVSLGYDHPSGLFADWRTRFVGPFYADDANSERIDEYRVTDISVGYRRELGDWIIEPFLGVENLFDTAYFANVRINAFGGRYFEPGPGRSFYGGIRIRFAWP